MPCRYDPDHRESLLSERTSQRAAQTLKNLRLSCNVAGNAVLQAGDASRAALRCDARCAVMHAPIIGPLHMPVRTHTRIHTTLNCRTPLARQVTSEDVDETLVELTRRKQGMPSWGPLDPEEKWEVVEPHLSQVRAGVCGVLIGSKCGCDGACGCAICARRQPSRSLVARAIPCR